MAESFDEAPRQVILPQRTYGNVADIPRDVSTLLFWSENPKRVSQSEHVLGEKVETRNARTIANLRILVGN
jgi:hypothetical protein